MQTCQTESQMEFWNLIIISGAICRLALCRGQNSKWWRIRKENRSVFFSVTPPYLRTSAKSGNVQGKHGASSPNARLLLPTVRILSPFCREVPGQVTSRRLVTRLHSWMRPPFVLLHPALLGLFRYAEDSFYRRDCAMRLNSHPTLRPRLEWRETTMPPLSSLPPPRRCFLNGWKEEYFEYNNEWVLKRAIAFDLRLLESFTRNNHQHFLEMLQ